MGWVQLIMRCPVQHFCMHSPILRCQGIILLYSGVGMTCTLGGLIQYHVQFMCSIIACLVYDQANINGGAIAPPVPMVPTPMLYYAHTHLCSA